MRSGMRRAMPLMVVSFIAAEPAHAQVEPPRVPSPNASVWGQQLPDSLAWRVRAPDALQDAWWSQSHGAAGENASRGSVACPMPVRRPDATTHYAAVGGGEPPRSGDPMPMQKTSCTNPLDAHP